MNSFSNKLTLDRCPHCNIANPNLKLEYGVDTTDCNGEAGHQWSLFICNSCGGCVLGSKRRYDIENGFLGFTEIFPQAGEQASKELPDKAKSLLQQAIDTIHAPSASIVTSAAAIDAMLKAKGYKKGDLYPRIDKAAEKHLITKEMAIWAHDVRLDANDQRHADEEAPLPKKEDAERCVEFAKTLGEFLFVLPAKVQRGRKDAEAKERVNNVS